jgi:hypothetical protein
MVQQLDEYDLTEIYKKLKQTNLGTGKLFDISSTHPELYKELADIGNQLGFEFTQVVINRNFKSYKHKDQVKGITQLVSCGDYTGGELLIEGDKTEYVAYHRPTIFEGRFLLHWNKPHIGDKFTICWWSQL